MVKLLHLCIHQPEAAVGVRSFRQRLTDAFNVIYKTEKINRTMHREIQTVTAEELGDLDLQKLHDKFPGHSAREHPVNLIVYTDTALIDSTLQWLQGLIGQSREKSELKKLGAVCVIENTGRDARNSDEYDDGADAEVVSLKLPIVKGLKSKLAQLDFDKLADLSAFKRLHVATPPDNDLTMALCAAKFAKNLRR